VALVFLTGSSFAWARESTVQVLIFRCCSPDSLPWSPLAPRHHFLLGVVSVASWLLLCVQVGSAGGPIPWTSQLLDFPPSRFLLISFARDSVFVRSLPQLGFGLCTGARARVRPGCPFYFLGRRSARVSFLRGRDFLFPLRERPSAPATCSAAKLHFPLPRVSAPVDFSRAGSRPSCRRLFWFFGAWSTPPVPRFGSIVTRL
jgi:hypothetical protein